MIWILLGEVSSKVALLVTTFASARQLSPGDFAIYSGFLAIILTSAAVGDAGLSQLLTRELASGRAGVRSGLRHIAAHKARLLPLWAITFAVSTGLLLSNQAIGRDVVLGYGVASLLIAAQLPLLAALRGQLRFREVAATQAAGRWLTASVLLVAWLTPLGELDPVLLVMGATVAGELVITVVSMILSAFRSPRLSQAVGGRLTIRNAAPFAANTVLSLVYNRMDIVFVAALTTATQLNQYAPASRIQDATYILPTVVTSVAFPLFARLLSDNQNANESRAQRRFLLMFGLGVTIPAISILTIIAPQFISLILGDEFLGSVTATRVLVWSIPFSVVNAALLAQITAGPRPIHSTWVFLTAFVSSLLLQVLLAPAYGAVGAAIASFAREPLAMVTAIVFLRRAARESTIASPSVGLAEEPR